MPPRQFSPFSLGPYAPPPRPSRPGSTGLPQGQRPQAADALLVQVPRLGHPRRAAHLTASARPRGEGQAPPPRPRALPKAVIARVTSLPSPSAPRPPQETRPWYGAHPGGDAKNTKTANAERRAED